MKNISLTIFFSLIILACGSDDGGGTDTPPTPMAGPPTAATLVFPENNTECNTGVIDPSNDQLSTVTFRWSASENTDTYTVNLVNLNNNQSNPRSTSATELAIRIQRGTPYSWSVTSSSNETSETAESSTFQFFNEGPGIETFAPFPAQAVNPQRGSTLDQTTASVVLQWAGNDVDNDIAEYEVFFGTSPDSMVEIGGTTAPVTQLTYDGISSGNTYYWRVRTIDGRMNTSNSEIFQFAVQ